MSKRTITYNLQGKKINQEFLDEIRLRFNNKPYLGIGTDLVESNIPKIATAVDYYVGFSSTRQGLEIWDDEVRIHVINYDQNGEDFSRQETATTRVKDICIIKGAKVDQEYMKCIVEFVEDPTKTFTVMTLPKGDIEFLTHEFRKPVTEQKSRSILGKLKRLFWS